MRFLVATLCRNDRLAISLSLYRTHVIIDILIYNSIIINIDSSHTFDGGEWKASFFSINTTIYIYYSIDFYLFVGVIP